MFEVKNLTKIYSKNKKVETKAVDNISFTLGETGLTCILGKSGSGKSTLLNLLSTLDEKSSGKIIYNQNDFDNLTDKEKTILRNHSFGFAFQNDSLIEEFTVKDNLSLVIDSYGESKITNSKFYENYLEEIGLKKDYLKKYPSELSAGERARVSLLRAIIKKSRVLFADEPTGNVDQKTAKLILDFLKRYSHELLIVMVTHNQDDALEYADRIIRLQDGKIIEDLTKNGSTDNSFKVINRNIYLPYAKPLNEREVQTLNSLSKDPYTRIYQSRFDFGQTRYVNVNREKEVIDDRKPKHLFKYGFKLLSKRLITICLMSFIVAFLLVVGNVSYNLSNYSVAESKENFYNNYCENRLVSKTVEFQTENINGDSLEEITESDLKIIDDNYDGKCYKMYPISLFYYMIRQRKTGAISYLVPPYIYDQTNGLIITEESYLKELYGNKNGELEVLAGSLNCGPTDVIITDYLADSLFYNKYTNFSPKTYDDLLNHEFDTLKIGAIINSHYKENYADLLSKIEGGANRTEHLNFNDYAYSNLAALYTFNENYIGDFIEYQLNTDSLYSSTYVNKERISFNGKNLDLYFEDTYISYLDELKNDEVSITLQVFNELTGKDYIQPDQVTEDDLENMKIDVSFFTSFQSDKEKVGLKNLKVKEISPINANKRMRFSKNVYRNIAKETIVPVRIYFDNKDDLAQLLVALEGTGLSLTSVYELTFDAIEETVLLFKDVFITILIVMGVLSFAFVLLIVILILKKDKKNIGIFRSLGLKVKEINLLYIEVLLSILIFSSIFLFVGTELGNRLVSSILIESFTRHYEMTTIPGLVFLDYNFVSTIALFITLIVFVLIALIIPLVVIKKNKPIEIIRSKE